jgi:tape measure domain-containing protein
MKEELIVSLTADIKDLKSSLDKASSELNSFASKTKTSANQINNSFSEIGNSVKNLVLGYVSLQAATSALGASFDRALKLDSINASMTAIMGSSEAAAEQFKKLSDFANQYGLNLIAVSDSYKNFSASALSANVSLEQTDYIFQSVAKAAAVLKLSNDDLKGALNAMAQMISKGTVQAEELRGQLGERLPGAFNIAAKAMGVTTAELGKMLQNGEVMAGELLPKLAEELNKSFGDKIVGNVDNLQASINRLDNSFTEAVQKGNIGVFFKQIVDGANEAVKIFESSSWTEFGTRVLALATGNQFLKVQIDAVTEAQKNLNKEVSKTPKSDLTKTFGTTTKPKAAGRQFTEPLELMQGAKEQIATAKE